MPRPRNLNPEPKKYIVKQKLKNGGYHVLERTTVFDPDRRQMKILSTRLIGKLEPGQTDLSQMVETDKLYSRNKKKTATGVVQALDVLSDTRRIECVTYPMDVVLLVVVLAAVCGFTSNYAIAEFWAAHRNTFERLIKGFPKSDISHDTVRRIIKLLGVQDASKLLRRFTEPLIEDLAQRIVSLDGQAVRAASKVGKAPRYALNVYDSDLGLCLNQVWIEHKENEITRAVEAIGEFDLKGAVLTCDALNTQKKLCGKLLEKGADYCMALKSNHAYLYDEVAAWFKTAKAADMVKTAARVDKGHGRYGEHSVFVLPCSIVELNRELVEQWPGLEDGCLVKTTTKRTSTSTGDPGEQTRYFITSLAFDSRYIAERLMRCIRSHWEIENSLHWCLDVIFNQDRTQCSNADYIKGRTVLSKIAFNLLSKLQSAELQRTGKRAPSKPILKARFSNPEALITAIAQLFASEK